VQSSLIQGKKEQQLKDIELKIRKFGDVPLNKFYDFMIKKRLV
jgi:hypothetical protein